MTAEESFDEMSNDINSLLSQFKTNMMNNGVVVESGDKFKSLIDKIATMAEEGEGKGIQYITNTVDWSVTRNDIYAEGIDVIVDDLTFKPSFVLVELTDEGGKKLIYSKYHHNVDEYVMLYAGSGDYGYKQIYGFIEITDNGFNIHHTASSNPISYTFSITYHIIGVGEEDTTLRDSLASILGDKGIDVTEEDDMASLITKVDNMTSNMIKYKSGIHEYTYDGSTRISFEVTGIGFRPTFVQICRVNKTQTNDGYIFWINNAYMNDSNSIYVPVEKSALKSTSYTGLNGSAKYNELVVNDDGFSLNVTLGGTTGDLWHFEWFVLG